MTHTGNRGPLLLLCCLISLTGCSPAPPSAAAPQVVTGLAVAQVRSTDVPDTIDAAGTVQAKESAVLSSQTMGRITSVTVREGDSVRTGQLLVSLDAAEAELQSAAAQANVAAGEHRVETAQSEADLAKSTLARYRILRDRKSVSPQEFDEVERRSETALDSLEATRAQLAAAQATLAGSRTAADYARIRAPFAGIVTARHVDPGTLATPGLPLLEVEKQGSLQLNLSVDESLLPRLKKGMVLPVEVPGLPLPNLRGAIAEIDPTADPSSHTFLVKVGLPASAGLHAGMSGSATIPGKSRPALLIPALAIVTHGSIHGAWVVADSGMASMRYLTLGAHHGDAVEALSGIGAGETVVLSPADRELGGRRIEAAR